jgi:hypothetical protein
MEDELTPDEARYAAALTRAEQRRMEAEPGKYHVGHPSHAAFEKSAATYRVIAEKLERQSAT